MGIVVTLFMMLGMWLLSPLPPSGLRWLKARPGLDRALTGSLMLAGLWNALWYGARHLQAFWGMAALVSGILMIAAAGLILVQRGGIGPQPLPEGVKQALKAVSGMLSGGLLACFMLYSVTLVRLNLGYSIIE